MSAILKKLDEIGASADCSCGEGCCGPSETDARSLVRSSSKTAPWITESVPTPAGDVPVAADKFKPPPDVKITEVCGRPGAIQSPVR